MVFQRCSFAACIKDVLSLEEEEYIMALDSTKKIIWEFKIVNTRCKESNFDLMACDFISLSLKCDDMMKKSRFLNRE
jgi:hypothetical protein